LSGFDYQADFYSDVFYIVRGGLRIDGAAAKDCTIPASSEILRLHFDLINVTVIVISRVGDYADQDENCLNQQSATAWINAIAANAPLASPFSKSPTWPIWFVTCAKQRTGL